MDERDMTRVDDDTVPLRVLDLWFDTRHGTLEAVSASDVTVDDLAEFSLWVNERGRTTAHVSEVYRPLMDASGGLVFAKIGEFRHEPQAEMAPRPKHRTDPAS
ncbi:hypothetical protein BKD30_02025 [Tersicoccus phoenicis]|uniref:Uncharacterized protein n=1 Tax=Tersicoccus phoenicis TaxID=554083 RepID=A0A1R1LL81_9MICC|nr:hypothetical protein BKD30_02025 [Tersicoccus phoenicis]